MKPNRTEVTFKTIGAVLAFFVMFGLMYVFLREQGRSAFAGDFGGGK